MRGASALGELLAKYPAAKARVLVVWLPVVATDTGPPTAEVRAPLRDPRVVEFWDEGHYLSPLIVERALLLAKERGTASPVERGDTVWDAILYFAPGVTWEDPFPAPPGTARTW